MNDQLPEPSQNLPAERAAVGAAIQHPAALAAVLEATSPDRFYRPAHETVLRAAQSLADAGQPVDPVTVAAELERSGDLAKVGGNPYLLDLIQASPAASNAGYYAQLVERHAVMRDLAYAGTHIHQLAQQPTDDPAALVDRARSTLDQLAAGRRGEENTWTAEQLAERALTRYSQPSPPGLRTGWRDIDRVLAGGMRPGTLTVVGARPKVGKSMIGVALPLQVATAGHPAAIASLEMPEAELADRIIAQMSEVELETLQKCNLSQEHWQAVEDAARRFRPLPLTILDSKRQTLTSMRTQVRDLQRGPGCELLVVDYLGLVTPADTKVNRQEQVAAISRGLKLLAGELSIPVVALAQINRGPEQRAERRPLPSDLRESGAIEADADQVWLLHRDPDIEGEIEVNIAYNRHGPAATVYLAWAPRYARVRDLIRFADDTTPEVPAA